jgi:hypothetical protein
LTNSHKIDIFQSAINHQLGGGLDISLFSEKSLGSEGNFREI